MLIIINILDETGPYGYPYHRLFDKVMWPVATGRLWRKTSIARKDHSPEALPPGSNGTQGTSRPCREASSQPSPREGARGST